MTGKALLFAITSLVAIASPAVEEAYVGGGVLSTFVQGGSKMRHRVGGAANIGVYFSPDIAAEFEVGELEGQTSLAAKALWHLHGWEEFNLLFGYERFDPFLAIGARGFLGDGAGDIGPLCGLGAMYYLSDNWALRFDGDASVGLDTTPTGIYSVALSLRYSF